MIEILLIIKENNQLGMGSGRTYILKALHCKGFNITEAIVRKQLYEMNDLGYIISSKGRGGSKITSLGYKILENI